MIEEDSLSIDTRVVGMKIDKIYFGQKRNFIKINVYGKFGKHSLHKNSRRGH